MAIPKINEEDITAAIKYIEENGVPEDIKVIQGIDKEMYDAI